MDCSFWLSLVRGDSLVHDVEEHHADYDPDGLFDLPIPAPPEVHRHLPAYAVYKTHCAVRDSPALAALMGPKRCARQMRALLAAALRQEVLSLGVCANDAAMPRCLAAGAPPW